MVASALAVVLSGSSSTVPRPTDLTGKGKVEHDA